MQRLSRTKWDAAYSSDWRKFAADFRAIHGGILHARNNQARVALDGGLVNAFNELDVCVAPSDCGTFAERLAYFVNFIQLPNLAPHTALPFEFIDAVCRNTGNTVCGYNPTVPANALALARGQVLQFAKDLHATASLEKVITKYWETP
jgi:hypothetical protein